MTTTKNESRRDVKEFASDLSDAYSADRYGSDWSPCIKALRKLGLTDRQVEAVIRSKWTRWAADAADKDSGANSADLVRWMKKLDSMMEQVEEMTRETFGMSEADAEAEAAEAKAYGRGAARP